MRPDTMALSKWLREDTRLSEEIREALIDSVERAEELKIEKDEEAVMKTTFDDTLAGLLIQMRFREVLCLGDRWEMLIPGSSLIKLEEWESDLVPVLDDEDIQEEVKRGLVTVALGLGRYRTLYKISGLSREFSFPGGDSEEESIDVCGSGLTSGTTGSMRERKFEEVTLVSTEIKKRVEEEGEGGEAAGDRDLIAGAREEERKERAEDGRKPEEVDVALLGMESDMSKKRKKDVSKKHPLFSKSGKKGSAGKKAPDEHKKIESENKGKVGLEECCAKNSEPDKKPLGTRDPVPDGGIRITINTSGCECCKKEPTFAAESSARELDIAVVFDCTGSMGSYLKTARDNIVQIADALTRENHLKLRFALIQYRDHLDTRKTYLTKVTPFTESVQLIKNKLAACSAAGGDDIPEAVADAYYELTRLSWKATATKIAIHITDAWPHCLLPHVATDNYPNGGPNGHDCLAIWDQLTPQGITLYVVGCEPNINPARTFYEGLAYKTGGRYVPLSRAPQLVTIIKGTSQEAMGMEEHVPTVQRIIRTKQEEWRVEDQMRGRSTLECAVLNVEREGKLAQIVCDGMEAEGIKTDQLFMGGKELPGASGAARNIAGRSRMTEVRDAYVSGAIASRIEQDKEVEVPERGRICSDGGDEMQVPMGISRGETSGEAGGSGSRDMAEYAVKRDKVGIAQAECLIQKCKAREKKVETPGLTIKSDGGEDEEVVWI